MTDKSALIRMGSELVCAEGEDGHIFGAKEIGIGEVLPGITQRLGFCYTRMIDSYLIRCDDLALGALIDPL